MGPDVATARPRTQMGTKAIRSPQAGPAAGRRRTGAPARPAPRRRCTNGGQYAATPGTEPRAAHHPAAGRRDANDTVALLRAQAGRDPYDRELTLLVGELSTRSEDFRIRWAAHDVLTLLASWVAEHASHPKQSPADQLPQ